MPATFIALSEDGTVAATVYRDESTAYLWNAATGEARGTVDFGGSHLRVQANDVLGDTEDNLFALNGNGEWLAVSFSDGALWVFNTLDSENNLELYDESDYLRFEGGFQGSCLAFCSNGAEESAFFVLDLDTLSQTLGASMATPFHVRADSSGIYLSSQMTLVRIDPHTAEQDEVAYTSADIASFTHTSDRTVVLTVDQQCFVFDADARQIAQLEQDSRIDFASPGGDYVLTADRNAQTFKIQRWERHDQAHILSYDSAFLHNEARLALDRNSAMLYRYNQFRVVDADGQTIHEEALPNAEEVRAEKYLRDSGEERLQVTYNDGKVLTYPAKTGTPVSESTGEIPDLDEEYEEGDYLIKSPVHGSPQIFDRASGELIATLEEDASLTDVTQIGDYLIAEFVQMDATAARADEMLKRYALLMDRKCNVLADLPNLCDILPDGTLIFDDMRGNLRESRIWTLEELRKVAERKAKEAQG